jgi:uncharacterized protein YPO0396
MNEDLLANALVEVFDQKERAIKAFDDIERIVQTTVETQSRIIAELREDVRRLTPAAPQAADDARAEAAWSLADALAARIDALQTQVENLTRALAHHEAHEYEHRAWAAESRVEELTRERDAAKGEVEILERLRDNYLVMWRTATAQIAALREALKDAREIILDLVHSCWSEAEGSDADWIGGIDAALASTKQSAEELT